MRLLTRYVCGEVLLNFEISLAMISGMLLFVEIARHVGSVGSTMGLLSVVPFLFPKVFEFSVPLSILLGTLLTFSRMSADNEIHAMYTFRINFWMILTPVVVLSFFIAMFSIINSEWVSPWCSKVLVNARNKTVIDMVLLKLDQEDRFMDKNLSVLKMKAEHGNKHSVYIYRNEDNKTQEIMAEDLKIIPDYQDSSIKLELKNANITMLDPENMEQRSISGFSGLGEMKIDLSKDKESRRNSEKSFRELLVISKDESKTDFVRRKSLYEFHRKLASSFSCILLGLFGVFMGLRLSSGSRIVGVSIVIGMVLLVYLPSIVVGKWLVLDSSYTSIPCWVGGWLPFFLIGLISIILRPSLKGT